MTEVIPRPKALDAVVFADVASRRLSVRLPDTASGYERLLWTQAWQRLRRAHEAGWADRTPWVYASTPSADRVVHATPGEAGMLVFAFLPGVAGFAELVGRVGLVAIVTIDLSSHYFLSCKFLHRPGRVG